MPHALSSDPPERRSPNPAAGADADAALPPPEITMVFQPMFDVANGHLYGYEALVRGRRGESASQVLARTSEEHRYALEQRCRRLAIELASRRGLLGSDSTHLLAINVQPSTVHRAEICVHTSVRAAQRAGLAPERLVLEVSERRAQSDDARLGEVFASYRRMGLKTAIDDAGVHRVSLARIKSLAPDVVKLDQRIVRGIEGSEQRREIVRALLARCEQVGAKLVAKGVETPEEANVLCELGVELFQGYLFGRPSQKPAS